MRPCCGLLELRAMRSVVLELYLDIRIHSLPPSLFATDRPQPPPPYPILDRPLTKGTVSALTRRALRPSPRFSFYPSTIPCVHTT